MRKRSSTAADLFSNPILMGSIILVVGIVGVVLSYNANKGLPFVPTYEIKADVPDAAQLIEGSSDVRVGGRRVGIVKTVEAMPGRNGRPAFARLTLALEPALERLPVDTKIGVRPRSLLGAKFLDLVPGRSEQGYEAGAVIPLRNAIPVVELDEAFNTFDRETTRGLRNTVTSLGDALAGRGTALNETVGGLSEAMPPLERVLRVLVAPETDLRGFVDGVAAAFQALEPVAPTFVRLIDEAATTLAAIDAAGDSIGRTIGELPATEAVGTRVLTKAVPVLDDAAAIMREIRSGTSVLPATARRLDSAVRTGTPVLARAPTFVTRLERSLRALDRLARNRPAVGTVRKLAAIGPTANSTLEYLVPAQTQCNTLGLYLRNQASTVSGGDATGNWLSYMPMFSVEQMFQRPAPEPRLHINYYPNANPRECESGNEPYVPGSQVIGNPAGLQRNSTESTADERANVGSGG